MRSPADGAVRAFLSRYEQAISTHNIVAWAALVAPEATYWHLTGTYVGKDAIVDAMTRDFAVGREETYHLTEIQTVSLTEDNAVLHYRFAWEPTAQADPEANPPRMLDRGRGTCVLVRRDGRWLVLHEHQSA